jgi:hypothetical protein
MEEYEQAELLNALEEKLGTWGIIPALTEGRYHLRVEFVDGSFWFCWYREEEDGSRVTASKVYGPHSTKHEALAAGNGLLGRSWWAAETNRILSQPRPRRHPRRHAIGFIPDRHHQKSRRHSLAPI